MSSPAAVSVLRLAGGLCLLLLAVLLAPVSFAGAKEATDEASSDEAGRYQNTVRWQTASEVDNFGYDVYRGDSEDGPFERLNAEPIPGAGTTDEPRAYVWVDDTIEPGKAYWYYVESISLAGERERFTPIFRARPKPEAEGEEPADDEDGDSSR